VSFFRDVGEEIQGFFPNTVRSNRTHGEWTQGFSMLKVSFSRE